MQPVKICNNILICIFGRYPELTLSLTCATATITTNNKILIYTLHLQRDDIYRGGGGSFTHPLTRFGGKPKGAAAGVDAIDFIHVCAELFQVLLIRFYKLPRTGSSGFLVRALSLQPIGSYVYHPRFVVVPLLAHSLCAGI